MIQHGGAQEQGGFQHFSSDHTVEITNSQGYNNCEYQRHYFSVRVLPT